MRTFWRSPFLTLILLAIDAVALARIWSIVYDLRASVQLFGVHINPPEAYMQALPYLLIVWLLILARYDFYTHHERIASLNRISPILWSVAWMLVAITVYNFILKPDFGRAVVGGFAICASLYLFLSRTIFRLVKRAAVRRGHGLVRALVVGNGPLGAETMARIHAHPDIGFRIVGFISAGNGKGLQEIEGYPILGGLEDMPRVIQRNRVEEVFLAVPDMGEDEIFHCIEEIQKAASAVCKVVANMLYVIANRAKVDEITGLPVIAFRNNRLTPAQLLVKRMIDLVGGGILLLAFGPFMLLFAMIIRIDSPGPVVFAHDRVGLKGKRFRLLKFRTMRRDADSYALAPGDEKDPRITRFGRFLRRTSLDELLQIFNVLRGDMSLVGPRPEMPFIVDQYKPWQRARLLVKPGLTGLWQVAGRKNLPLHYNLEYDYYYVKNQSIGLDIEILFRTLPAVLLGKGAY